MLFAALLRHPAREIEAAEQFGIGAQNADAFCASAG